MKMKQLRLVIATVCAAALLLSLQISAAYACHSITITPLGALPGGNTSNARDINEKGEIAGTSNATGWQNKAVKWTAKGNIIDLGFLPGTNVSLANGINNRGDVVGYCGYAVPLGTSFLTLPYRAVMWTAKGDIVNLGTLPGTNGSVATAINDNRDVVGYAGLYRTMTTPSYTYTTFVIYHAFLWTAKDGMKDIGTLPGGNMSSAFDINNNGQIVGYSNGTNALPQHAVMWTRKGAITDIGTLQGGNTSIARGINENGQVVGSSNWGSTISQQAFLWTAKHGMKPLGWFPGGNMSYATAINNNGQIVGYGNQYGISGVINHAFLWTAKEGFKDLGTLPGQNASMANGINDNGQIVGQSYISYTSAPFGTPNYTAVLWNTRGCHNNNHNNHDCNNDNRC